MNNRLFAILILPLLFSCVKDKPVPAAGGDVNVSAGNRIFTVNEGNFGSGNASISMIDPDGSGIVEDYFRKQNNTVLGDVAQSMCNFNGNLYIVVNNSGKIVVCSQDLKQTGTISGMLSPRYLLGITPKKAYVSDFKSNQIHVVDLNARTVSGGIKCGGWTEQMLMVYNKAFVTNMKRDYVYVINTMNDVVADSVFVGPSAGSLVLDKLDRIWVLSGGDQSKNIDGTLTLIDPLNNIALKRIQLNGQHPFCLSINGSRDKIYYINKDVMQRDITDLSSQGSVIVTAGQSNFYGMGVHPHNGDLYVSDAIDYSQRSGIFVYKSDGSNIRNMKSGVNTSSFYFE